MDQRKQIFDIILHPIFDKLGTNVSVVVIPWLCCKHWSDRFRFRLDSEFS